MAEGIVLHTDFLNTLSAAGDLAGGAQCLFLLLFLLSRPAGRSPANMMIAAATLVLELCLIDDFLGAERFYPSSAPGFEYIGNVFPCLIGPLVYLHVEAQVAPGEWRLTRRHWRHGICFAVLASFLLLALAFPFPHELSSANMTSAALPRLLFAVASTLGAYLITAAQGGLYLYWAVRLTRQGRAEDRIRLSWVRLLLRVLSGLWLLYVLDDGIQLIVGRLPLMNAAFAIGYVLILYGMAWISLHHGWFFQRTPEMMVTDIVAPLRKYRKSAQTAEDAERIIVKIEAVFARNRLFRDSSLSLASLAQSIGARPNAVSQAINQYLGLSYFDFVNRYRVEEAKKLLSAADKDTDGLLDIAFSVGFNSKSTFNAAFKKHSGLTPSDFRKKVRGAVPGEDRPSL
ncbi:helix-turn-helix domain-containing protein [Telmatospirillum siberiense]|nr:helix-turn-helix transcriptional regulator [Telmatospirillum siberiense]